MELVTSFVTVMQPLQSVMTTPTWNNFQILVVGWMFAPKRTITRMIQAAGVAGQKHHSAFHRIFAKASWSLDLLGLAVFQLLKPFCQGTVFLAVDNTLARKRGLKMFGTDMHYDPLISSRSKKLTSWGHDWVTLGVIVRFPLWPERPFCLPILFRLYLSQKQAKKYRRTHRTHSELFLQMLKWLCRHEKSLHFHVVADSAYGGWKVVKALPSNCDLTSRLVLDARLHAAPPPKSNKVGRPHRRGAKQPTPREMLQKRCRHIELNIYGRNNPMRIASQKARIYNVPDRELLIVATEALRGGRGEEAFYSTATDVEAEQVLKWYADRWSIEVTNHDSKQYLGFEEPQGWTRLAVERTAPIAMLLYSLVLIWFAKAGHVDFQPVLRPWYTREHSASFADMLGWLRRKSVHQLISETPINDQGRQKLAQTVENLVQIAA